VLPLIPLMQMGKEKLIKSVVDGIDKPERNIKKR
jgi:hypothetical protein